MSKKVTTVLTILLWVLMAISAVLFISMMNNVDGEFMSEKGDALVDTNIRWAYALFGFGIVAAVGFSLYQIATSGKQALKALGSVAAFAVVAFIAYSIASDEIPTFHNSDVMVENGDLTAAVAKTTDTLLYLTYFLLGGAVFSIVYSSVSRLWR